MSESDYQCPYGCDGKYGTHSPEGCITYPEFQVPFTKYCGYCACTGHSTTECPRDTRNVEKTRMIQLLEDIRGLLLEIKNK